ncbi:MAG TPA: serine hydrolase domain-containing protein [Alphaproteobacteria bacterium]
MQVCFALANRPEARRSLEVPERAVRLLAVLGKVTRGPCETELLPDDLELARITAGEQAEDQTARLLQHTVDPPLDIDELNSIPPDAAVMGQCIDNAYAAADEVGYSYAIVKSGQLAYMGQGGSARAPWEADFPNVAMTPLKPMTIASISKTITAVAVMKLLEQNPSINLDDPFYPLIEDKFSGQVAFDGGLIATLPGPGVAAVSIRNLLMHRSGLTPGLGCGYANLAKLIASGVVGTPGATYDYENSNFCLLREVIEQVSGMDYIDFVQDNVLGPMGITDMACEPEDTDPTLYYNTIGDPGYLWGDFNATCSAYGWNASAVDLAQFMANVRVNTVLTPESTEEMQNGSCLGGYCLGWIRSDNAIGVHHWHNGDWIDSDPCDVPGALDDIIFQPSTCPRGFNGTVMRFQLGIDAVLLVNTRGGTGIHPGLKSEVTILRECFAEAFLDANDIARVP